MNGAPHTVSALGRVRGAEGPSHQLRARRSFMDEKFRRQGSDGARALGHEGSRPPLGYVYRYDPGITCCAAKASTYSTSGRLYQRPSNEGAGGAGVGSSRSRKARYTRAPMPTINSM